MSISLTQTDNSSLYEGITGALQSGLFQIRDGSIRNILMLSPGKISIPIASVENLFPEATITVYCGKEMHDAEDSKVSVKCNHIENLENATLPYFELILLPEREENAAINWERLLRVIHDRLSATGVVFLALPDNFAKDEGHLFGKCGFGKATIVQNCLFAKKQLDPIQVKAELLYYGIKPNDYTKELFHIQNPESVWKTGNNGIFISFSGLDVFVSTNHEFNITSPYELEQKRNHSVLLRNGEVIYDSVELMEIPEWFYTKIPTLNGAAFSKYFVFEGHNYLHLAYKGCSFSATEKCKFCGTDRRDNCKDNTAADICKAIEYVIDQWPCDINVCLGGGTYLPYSENVEYFSTIIKCIRKHSKTIPIWVEMIPPSLEEIACLIDAGATSFGFNIEVWNDSNRQHICPGKSKISREHYITACKFVRERLGDNRVGSCIIMGLNSYAEAKTAVDAFVADGIEPCILPYKEYDDTNLSGFTPYEYKYDFYRMSKYAADEAKKHGVVFSENQGCLKCTCCTIMHDLQHQD